MSDSALRRAPYSSGGGWLGRAVGACALLLAFAACKLDRVAVGEGQDGLVVHAVLNPSTFEQYFIVERVLTGAVRTATLPTLADSGPVVNSGGIPVQHAEVRLTAVNGFYAIGVETAPGVYRINNLGAKCGVPPSPLYCQDHLELGGGGATFRLDVVASGRSLSASTTLPGVERANAQIITRDTIEAGRDTLQIRFPTAVGSSRFLFRVGTPYGPFELFTDSTRVSVATSLTNATATDFPPAFVPGFQQSVVIAAVDENYFDYYRTANSPFTGAGLISHVEGGTGVFGSMKVLDTRRLEVRAPFVDPIDGRYLGGATGRDTLELWVGAKVHDGRLVSGDLRTVLPNDLGSRRVGVLGALDGDRLALRVLKADRAADVDYTLSGTAGGGTLTLRRGGAATNFHRVTP